MSDPIIAFEKTESGQALPLPSPATEQSCGMDLRAAEAMVLEPGHRALVPCGFKMALPPMWEAQIRPRSGLAYKHGVTVLNTPGTIDADYRGEVKVLLINHGEAPFSIQYGDRIAQMVLAQVLRLPIKEVDQLSETDRGEGGFGHTGQK